MTGCPSVTDQDRLRGLTAQLLDPGQPVHGLREPVLQLAALLADMSPLKYDPHADIAHGETRTANGVALSPTMAAMCAQDYVRTIRFIRGLHAAIMATRAQHPQRPARVLYVGCGPFAMLAVPLMAWLGPEQARFTLLEVSPQAMESARAVVDALDLSSSVQAFESIDAADYHVDCTQPPDVILMEIMRACLETEPQVAITRHLLPQAPDALLIPQRVQIDLVLVDPAREFAVMSADGPAPTLRRDRITLGPVFVLDRAAVASWPVECVDQLAGMQVRIPESILPQHQLMLLTTIHVFAEQVLVDYESGLSYPRVLALGQSVATGNVLEFHYQLGPRPQLRCEVVGAA